MKAKTYGLDIYRNGAWIAVARAFASVEDAILFTECPNEHFHIWFNGDCVFDSRPGEPEPENIA